jgi:hypothetical protein
MSEKSNAPKPYPSWVWVINEIGDGYWDSPKPAPLDGKVYAWNETDLNWVERPATQ